MKKSSVLLLLVSIAITASSQEKLPSYIDIIRTFCSSYVPLEENENFTCFAKKKDGWYVQQTNRLQSDSTLEERLFYDAAKKSYTDLNKWYEKATAPDIDNFIEKYIQVNGSIGDWYCFDIIPYYGYNGWFIDLINDYSQKEAPSEAELDGLGRAYDYLANSYLWYQSGGIFPVGDTLHRKLARLEYPSKQRIGMLKEALDKGITQFEKLATINPVYRTIVGNGTLKLFNEYMHGYNQMQLCGADELAKEYLDKTALPEPYVLQAKNYLNSCLPNAVLFSFGDNDTYQLWYVQEKYNYRKDVLVVNNSLLGMPVYIDMFKRKKILRLTIPDAYLRDPGSDAAYYIEDKKNTGEKIVPLKEFLNTVYTKKYPTDFAGPTTYPTYSNTAVSLRLPGSTKDITFKPQSRYSLVNDIAMLDIIANNTSTRPVYFTSSSGVPFEKNLVQEGIVYKVTDQDPEAALPKAKAIRNLEKFIAEKHVPVLSNDAGLISYDGDNTFLGLYYKLLSYYADKKDTIHFKKWMDKFDHHLPSMRPSQLRVGFFLSYLYFDAGEDNKAEKLINQYALWLEGAYKYPSALNGFYSKKTYSAELKNLQMMLSQHDKKNNYIDGLLDKINDPDN